MAIRPYIRFLVDEMEVVDCFGGILMFFSIVGTLYHGVLEIEKNIEIATVRWKSDRDRVVGEIASENRIGNPIGIGSSWGAYGPR
jgi:hypothetical protein